MFQDETQTQNRYQNLLTPNIHHDCKKFIQMNPQHEINLGQVLIHSDHSQLSIKGRLTDNVFKELLQFITKMMKVKKWKYFREFSLRLITCKELSDQSMKSLSKFLIQNFQHIQSFKICFLECNKISAEGMKLLSSSAIRKLIHLKRLQIRFISLWNPDDLVIKRISLDLKQLKHLQKLTIDLSGRSENLNQRPKEILYDISQRVMNVTPSKGFYIDENQVGDRGLKYLTRSLTNYHKGLKDLTLVFALYEY